MLSNMNPNDSQTAPPLPSTTAIISRRGIVGAALAALAVAEPFGSSEAHGGKPKHQDAIAEGFFVVFEKDGTPESVDRIFFLKSEWLSYFEITDLYNPGQIPQVVKKINGNAAFVKNKWSVLYTDDLKQNDTVQSSLAVAKFPAPPANETYLAMSLSPDLV